MSDAETIKKLERELKATRVKLASAERSIVDMRDGTEEQVNEKPKLDHDHHGVCPNCGAGMWRFIRLGADGHYERKQCSEYNPEWIDGECCTKEPWRKVSSVYSQPKSKGNGV